jgi:hypothetical protein
VGRNERSLEWLWITISLSTHTEWELKERKQERAVSVFEGIMLKTSQN